MAGQQDQQFDPRSWAERLRLVRSAFRRAAKLGGAGLGGAQELARQGLERANQSLQTQLHETVHAPQASARRVVKRDYLYAPDLATPGLEHGIVRDGERVVVRRTITYTVYPTRDGRRYGDIVEVDESAVAAQEIVIRPGASPPVSIVGGAMVADSWPDVDPGLTWEPWRQIERYEITANEPDFASIADLEDAPMGQRDSLIVWRSSPVPARPISIDGHPGVRFRRLRFRVVVVSEMTAVTAAEELTADALRDASSGPRLGADGGIWHNARIHRVEQPLKAEICTLIARDGVDAALTARALRPDAVTVGSIPVPAWLARQAPSQPPFTPGDQGAPSLS